MDANQSLQELDKDKLIEALVKKLGENVGTDSTVLVCRRSWKRILRHCMQRRPNWERSWFEPNLLFWFAERGRSRGNKTKRESCGNWIGFVYCSFVKWSSSGIHFVCLFTCRTYRHWKSGLWAFSDFFIHRRRRTSRTTIWSQSVTYDVLILSHSRLWRRSWRRRNRVLQFPIYVQLKYRMLQPVHRTIWPLFR